MKLKTVRVGKFFTVKNITVARTVYVAYVIDWSSQPHSVKSSNWTTKPRPTALKIVSVK